MGDGRPSLGIYGLHAQQSSAGSSLHFLWASPDLTPCVEERGHYPKGLQEEGVSSGYLHLFTPCLWERAKKCQASPTLTILSLVSWLSLELLPTALQGFSVPSLRLTGIGEGISLVYRAVSKPLWESGPAYLPAFLPRKRGWGGGWGAARSCPDRKFSWSCFLQFHAGVCLVETWWVLHIFLSLHQCGEHRAALAVHLAELTCA